MTKEEANKLIESMRFQSRGDAYILLDTCQNLMEKESKMISLNAVFKLSGLNLSPEEMFEGLNIIWDNKDFDEAIVLPKERGRFFMLFGIKLPECKEIDFGPKEYDDKVIMI